MNIEFTGRHYHLNDDIKEFAQKKLHKIDSFVEDPIEVHWILETEKKRHIAELVLRHRHGTFQAKEEADAMHDAVLSAAEVVVKQARRTRKKFMDKRRKAQRQADHAAHWSVDVLEGDSVSTGAPRVIRTSNLQIKPMTIDEASMALEQSRNDFFVFRDSGTERVSVLYRRKDNDFGLIAPEF